MEITYGAYEDSALGSFVLGWTKAGLCYLGFGREEALFVRFPKAVFQRDPREAQRRGRTVIAAWRNGQARALDLDLSCGTAFQRAVWQALLSIPFGRTRSYKEIAQAIGNPKAFRAVGQALGANPVALLVPCHRVLASGGALGGYAWGPAVKKRLLKAEGLACS